MASALCACAIGPSARSADAGSVADADVGPAGECGNGVVEAGEACDDGNGDDNDGCTAECALTCVVDADCSNGNSCDGIERCEAGVCVDGAYPVGIQLCTLDGSVAGVCRTGLCTPMCNPLTPFSDPVEVPELNSTSVDFEAVMSPDELTVYFSSDRPGGAGDFDIWWASRSSLAASFGAVAPLPQVNSVGRDSYPSITADGLALYAQAGNTVDGYDIVRATRVSTDVEFGALLVLSAFTDDDYDPYIMPDESALYFGSRRSGNSDLYRATRDGDTFLAPMPVHAADVNTDRTEGHAVVTSDERALYFGSGRDGGMGNVDVYVATRDNPASEYGAAVHLASVSSPEREFPTWISVDQCTMLLQRGDPWNIYIATRSPE